MQETKTTNQMYKSAGELAANRTKLNLIQYLQQYGLSDNQAMKESIDTLLTYCSSYDRLKCFYDITRLINLEPGIYWSLLADAYSMSDNLYIYRDHIKELFSANKPRKELLMNESELSYLESLPDELQIYRGMTYSEFKAGNLGISWTLKKSVAAFFAFQYSRNNSTDELPKFVYSRKINKKDITAIFLSRNEFEVIYTGPGLNAYQKNY